MSGTHGMHAMPKTADVVSELRAAVDRADLKKAATWVKFLPSSMAEGKMPSADLRNLRHTLKMAIEAGDPAMLKVLFTENRRLAAILNGEQRLRVRWDFPSDDTILGSALVSGEAKVVAAIMDRAEDLEPAVIVGMFCDAASMGDATLCARIAPMADLTDVMDQFRAMGAAISGGNLEILRALRDRGIDFDACKLAPASFSISKRTLPVLADLCRMGLDVNERHPEERMGTALYTAMNLGDYQLVRGLLAHGADPNVTVDGVYLLESAINRTVGSELEREHRQAVAAIIDAGGTMPNIVHAQSAGGGLNGMLMAAAYFGAERLLTAHKEVLAKVSCRDHPALGNLLLRQGNVPGAGGLLGMAAAADNPVSVRILVKLGLPPDGDGDAERADPPLATAVSRNCAQAAQALIACGADHRIKYGPGGTSLLQWAEKNANEEVVRTLRAAEMSGKLMDAMSEDDAPSVTSTGVVL